MVRKAKKQDLVQMEWRKRKLASLEEFVLHRGSLH